LKFEFKFAVDGFVLSMPPPFELAAVGLRTVAAGSCSRERRADNYAVAALGKNLISTGQVRRMSIADGQCLLWWMCYRAVAVGGVARGAWEQQASTWSFLGGFRCVLGLVPK
jgi:hypothetical protein